MKLIILANNLSVLWVLIGLVAFFGLIALVVFFLRKYLKISNKNDKPTDETKIADENLSRYLQDVDDDATQKQFDEYSKEHQEDLKDDEKENK
jgi:ACR3 family arsenite efflux pump ArsB